MLKVHLGLLQISLIIGNIAAVDFPSEWPSLLQQLLPAVLQPSYDPQVLQAATRAARTMKQVLQSLQRKSLPMSEPHRGLLLFTACNIVATHVAGLLRLAFAWTSLAGHIHPDQGIGKLCLFEICKADLSKCCPSLQKCPVA